MSWLHISPVFDTRTILGWSEITPGWWRGSHGDFEPLFAPIGGLKLVLLNKNVLATILTLKFYLLFLFNSIFNFSCRKRLVCRSIWQDSFWRSATGQFWFKECLQSSRFWHFKHDQLATVVRNQQKQQLCELNNIPKFIQKNIYFRSVVYFHQRLGSTHSKRWSK